MKKVLAMVLVLVFALTGVCFAEEEAFTFRHGFDYSYPPYSYLNDDGETGGFDVAVCQAVCEYLGWNYEMVPFAWDNKDNELSVARSCDCIWSGFTVEGREDDYVWSIPYSSNDQVILTMADSGITTLEDLAGKIVGVQIDTSAQGMLLEEGSKYDLACTFGELMTYETYTLAVNDLEAGAIDAVAIDVTTCAYILSNKEDPTKFSVLEEIMGSENYAIGFRMEDEALCYQVNFALLALAKAGVIEEIANSTEEYAEILPYLTLTAENADALLAELAAASAAK